MLVIKRNNGQWVHVKLSRETLLRMLENGQEPELRFRVYDISGGNGQLPRVNIAFEDPERNFEIQRPERIAKMAALSQGLI